MNTKTTNKALLKHIEKSRDSLMKITLKIPYKLLAQLPINHSMDKTEIIDSVVAELLPNNKTNNGNKQMALSIAIIKLIHYQETP